MLRMNIEEEIQKIILEKDTEKIKRLLLAILRPEKIDLISREDFNKYFVITDKIRTIAKVFTAICKLHEKALVILTGQRGVGKTTTLRYLYYVLKNYMKVSMIDMPEKIDNAAGECIFVLDNNYVNSDFILSPLGNLDNKTIFVESKPYWVLQLLEKKNFDKKAWQIMILMPPKESEIKEIVKKRFGSVPRVVNNPLLALLSQIKSEKELGLDTVEIIKKQRGTKLRILWALTSNTKGLFVKELSKILTKSPATISRHLKELEELNLVRAERIGKRIFYKISTVGGVIFTEETIIEEILRNWGNKVFII